MQDIINLSYTRYLARVLINDPDVTSKKGYLILTTNDEKRKKFTSIGNNQ